MPAPERAMSYAEIFDEQGVPEQFRGPDDYFFVRLTEGDSHDHAGEVYAIPSQVHVRGDMHGLYNHQENGAIIEERAAVDPTVTVGSRSIVGNAFLGEGVEIGAQSTVSAGTRLSATKVGNGVEISGADIDMADIDHESTIGQVRIQGGHERSVISTLVTLEDGVQLRGLNKIDSQTTVRKGAVLEEGAELGKEVEIGPRAIVRNRAEVRDGSYVMPSQTVNEGRVIRANTIVYPRKFKRARKSSQ